MRWLTDIDKIHSSHQAIVNKKTPKDKEEARLLLKLLRALYEKVSFRALDKLERPFIFAYSAMVNPNIVS